MNHKHFSFTTKLAIATTILGVTLAPAVSAQTNEHPDVTVVNSFTREVGEFNQVVAAIEAGQSVPEGYWSELNTTYTELSSHTFAKVNDEYEATTATLLTNAESYKNQADAVQSSPVDDPRQATEALNASAEAYSQQVGQFEAALVSNAQFQDLNLANPFVRVVVALAALLLIGVAVGIIVFIRRRKNRSMISKNKK